MRKIDRLSEQEQAVEQQRIQRRERAHALFLQMRPYIRGERLLRSSHLHNAQVAVAKVS